MAGEELRRLCSEGGWTYAALWCNDCRDPRMLVLAESYHEEQSRKIFEKVVNQVHVIGQGTIGEVAITGKHQWIIFDTICMKSSEMSSTNNPVIFQGSAEWEDQILAGIKTIAVIPLPSLGVLQFGSILKIGESSDFIAQAQNLFWQLRIKPHAFSMSESISSGPFNLFKSNIWAEDIDSSSYMENFLLSQDRNPGNSTLLHSNTKSPKHQIHNNFMNNPIYSCEQANEQFNDGLSIPFPYQNCDRNVHEHQLVSDHDLFDGMELNLIPMISVVSNGCTNFSISELEMSSVAGSGKGLLSDSSSFEQLLEAVVAGNANVSVGCNSKKLFCEDSELGTEPNKNMSRHPFSWYRAVPLCTEAWYNSVPGTVAAPDSPPNASYVQCPDRIISSNSVATMNSVICQDSKCDLEKTMQGPLSDAQSNSNVYTWIDDTCSVNAEGSALHQPMKLEECTKVVRKRARPRESTRPRPKDRQQIQDRVKELREIVPNGAKCSIDSLLDRTIKHMLFLQSVMKYVDKLKQADEPKIMKLISEKSGVVLKDNINGEGGAAWTYDGQTMACPILVEDVYPSGQMLVEMLCEERGFFLEIADVVRGFGLTILKGDIEIRERKVWARFLVEANRYVTRMEIFLSLVKFLQQASSFQANELQTRAISSAISAFQ